MVQLTKIGTGLIGGLIVVGFAAVGYGQYMTNQTVKNYQPVVITKTIVVSPTLEPTATPAATLKTVVPVKKPLTK